MSMQAFLVFLFGTILCAQSKKEIIGEVQLTNANRPFVSFGYDTMKYTSYPLKESAELIAVCQPLDSKAEWTTVRNLEFVPFSQEEKKIISGCASCRPSGGQTVESVCSYRKANIVLKGDKKLTGAYVYVSGEGVKGPDGEEYTFHGDRVKSFTAK